MRTTLTREYGGVNLDILVDYNEDGVCVEDILHKGESVAELLSREDYLFLVNWAESQHLKLLESDEYARADDLNDYRKD